MIEFKIPEVGENIETGTIVSIAVSVGDAVKQDQDLLELETDKASVPVPSPCDGTIEEILVSEGDEVNIGQVVMKIAEGGSGSAAPAAKEEKPAAKEEKAAAPSTPAPAPAATATATPPPPPAMNMPIASSKDVHAAPSVRRFAREIGINVAQVQGTGPRGRISINDVKAFAKQLNLSRGAIVSSGPEIKPLPDFTKFGEVEREKMNNIRKKTATHLSYAWQTIPHVTQFDKADITEIDKLRKSESTEERKLTITPFLMKIMAEALKEFPQFNTSIDMQTHEIIYKKYNHIGVAVDTDRGLLVPVIRDVDKKNIFDLTDDLNAAAERARTKKTSLDELQGGSMTLTNLGGIGGTSFTPIVNWPEVAILGVSRGGFEPVFNKETKEFEPRFKLPLSLSYDHRVIDGADGARFLRFICTKLEEPFVIEK